MKPAFWKEATRRNWSIIKPEVERHTHALWEKPELPAMEVAAARLLTEWLRGSGFDIDAPCCGMPTAFIARKRLGPGPCIAILAEYDALPGTANDAVPYRQSRGQRAGHSCGHNQIGAANCGAAIAALKTMQDHKIPGELIVIGCPAEEIVWGKVGLLKKGAFEGVDAILTSHGDYQNGVISRPCQSVVGGEIVFRGESGHGGSIRKTNALDAAELAVQSIERLRAHHFADTQVEHVLRVGGGIPNVTPDEARVWINARQADYDRTSEVYDFLVDVCKHSAQLVGVSFQHLFVSATHGYLPNDRLAEMMMANLQEVGPPAWSDEAKKWMQSLAFECAPNGAFDLDEEVGLYTEGVDPYGQDDGEVSWQIPLGRVNWAYPQQVPLHNWALTALAGYPGSYPGPLMASETLALSAIDLMLNPKVIEQAKEELTERTKGLTLDPPRVGAWETLTQNPEAFWDATWVE
ncbi:amidohydrolase [Pseudohalocynthiibacter aestuariivivens]|nr:amidohydrolase [Pseudohalocynthiibacter aestuariivivens]QIE46684.1 amidohydrolase [Pseudohalocynthiibacter aestuariivivens]